MKRVFDKTLLREYYKCMGSENVYNGVDRRKYPRVNASVTYSIAKSDLTQNMQASKNISEGGIAFFAKDQLSIGSVLDLELALPDMSSIKAMARVVWREPLKISEADYLCCELGVEFVGLDDQARKRITRYVFHRLDKG